MHARQKAPRRMVRPHMAALLGAAAVTSAAAAEAPSLADIVEVRTIDSLHLSADGERIAYRVLMPSLAANRVTEQWFAVDVDGKAAPRPLGREAEPVWMPLYDIPEDGIAAWSDSPEHIYARREREGQVQIYRLGTDGHETAVTDDAADVVDFTLTPGTRDLRYRTRAPRSEIARAQHEEERRGIRADRTLLVEGLRLTRNFRIGSRETALRWLDGNFGVEAFAGPLVDKIGTLAAPFPAAEPAPRARLPGLINPYSDGPAATPLPVPGTGLTVGLAEIAPAPKPYGQPLYQIIALGKDGTRIPCEAYFCRGPAPSMRAVTTNSRGEVVVIHEAAFSARSKLHAWNPRTGAMRLILDAEGSLDGGSGYSVSTCARNFTQLICVHEAPAAPPELVAIDVETGAMTWLARPNRHLSARTFPKTEFLSWTDTEGRTTTGVLVLPKNAPKSLPLVLTTYRCRGFLRGGTANVAPEFLLAEAGFAALCVNNNNASRSVPADTPLSEHKAAIAGYAAVIGQLAAKGIIDPARVGIAGHSYSSVVAAHALSHDDLFAAAVIGTGVTTDRTSALLAAPNVDSWRRSVPVLLGLPQPLDDSEGLWREVSPAVNAARIRAPLLIQSPENEYLYAMELYNAIQSAGGIVDMYVFPNEGHMVGREPVHQYYRARRSIDWFKYWLTDGGRERPKTLDDWLESQKDVDAEPFASSS